MDNTSQHPKKKSCRTTFTKTYSRLSKSRHSRSTWEATGTWTVLTLDLQEIHHNEPVKMHKLRTAQFQQPTLTPWLCSDLWCKQHDCRIRWCWGNGPKAHHCHMQLDNWHHIWDTAQTKDRCQDVCKNRPLCPRCGVMSRHKTWKGMASNLRWFHSFTIAVVHWLGALAVHDCLKFERSNLTPAVYIQLLLPTCGNPQGTCATIVIVWTVFPCNG